MSELRVNTIAANSVSTINIDDDTLVSGTLTSTGTLTGQGNIVATGNVTAGSGLSGTSLALNGGNINSAGTVNCTGVTASGTVSSASLSVSGSASVGSLTIGGTAYDQRVVAHCTFSFGSPTAMQNGRFRSTSSVSILNNNGVSSTQWFAGPGSGDQTLRVTFTASRNWELFPTVFTCLNSSQEMAFPYFVDWEHITSGTTQMNIFGLHNAGSILQPKYIQMAIFG